MPFFALSIKAQCENVTGLEPADDEFSVICRVKCTSCHEEHPNIVGMQYGEEKELTKSRGTAHLVMSCNFCRSQMSAKFEEPTSKAPLYRPYAPPESSGADFQVLCVADCRGMEMVSFEPRGTWKCRSTASKTEFTDVTFEDGEWTDYDEKGDVPVSIMEFESKWTRR
ncbi:unnamed protein product [Tilletia controversa]|uniref:DUF866-domain-containing protein n=3 Tax=Tilletia TaxID=13289 RepID=A0A8X7MMF4_9BASI|nr:hypothetical protein CF336_g6784 [Tilletia laevis]KAE8189184.1 hypothetical protein CF328_g6363 [Tilletia controversa]KAE8252896.1 hypothetical protein A4X03_0g6042 [Tilletia caries]KAE8191307.1 hypothetical protein CF335_g6122 [Tilletia laevis]KAE8242110.1 hypothetical protein A4X06_0g7229 [Tilletia controversa]